MSYLGSSDETDPIRVTVLSLSKKKYSWMLKWSKQILFRTVEIGEKRPQYRTGSIPNTAGVSGNL